MQSKNLDTLAAGHKRFNQKNHFSFFDYYFKKISYWKKNNNNTTCKRGFQSE